MEIKTNAVVSLSPARWLSLYPQGYFPIVRTLHVENLVLDENFSVYSYFPDSDEPIVITSSAFEQNSIATGGSLLGWYEEAFSWQDAGLQDQIDNILSAEDMLGFIRANLSLNITELAAVLKVERPTIYAWLRGDALPQQKNIERLALIYSYAEEWAKHALMPAGDLVRSKNKNGKSIVSELSADIIDERYVKAQLKERGAKVKPLASPKSFRARLAKKGLSVKASDTGQDELNRASGKRISSDLD